MGSITYEERLARYSKQEQREIARGSTYMTAGCLVMHAKTEAEEFLHRVPQYKHTLIMLEIARIEAEWLAHPKKSHTKPKNIDGDEVDLVTTYRELLDNFPEKQQRAIQRGARFLQAKYERLYTQAKPRPKSKASSTTDIATNTNPPTPTNINYI